MRPCDAARWGEDDGTCSRCGKVCGPDDRYATYRQCKTCVIAAQRVRDAVTLADPVRKAVSNEQSRHAARKKKYGITRDEYEQRVKDQDGRCACCGEATSNLCVDHDHRCCGGTKTCGRCIRELVCADCNKMLGFADDSVDRLLAGAIYLQRFVPAAGVPILQ